MERTLPKVAGNLILARLSFLDQPSGSTLISLVKNNGSIVRENHTESSGQLNRRFLTDTRNDHRSLHLPRPRGALQDPPENSPPSRPGMASAGHNTRTGTSRPIRPEGCIAMAIGRACSRFPGGKSASPAERSPTAPLTEDAGRSSWRQWPRSRSGETLASAGNSRGDPTRP